MKGCEGGYISITRVSGQRKGATVMIEFREGAMIISGSRYHR